VIAIQKGLRMRPSVFPREQAPRRIMDRTVTVSDKASV
jgi:hypothetical protein